MFPCISSLAEPTFDKSRNQRVITLVILLVKPWDFKGKTYGTGLRISSCVLFIDISIPCRQNLSCAEIYFLMPARNSLIRTKGTV